MARIMIADDERAICDAFRRLLERDGHTAIVASSGEEALAAFGRETPDLVFLDVQMPDISGIDVLKEFQREAPHVPVVVITAHGTVDTAMRALEHGAFDYLGKPVELPQIRTLVERALHRPNASRPAEKDERFDETHHDRLVGTSREMQEVFKMVSLLTTNDLTVLLTGESGVGKDLIARTIHTSGARARHPFVAINCAAIPENLIESELFGHEKGAFTGADTARTGRFEAAGEGTIFLDEISELPYHLQAKLLRVLQDQTCTPVGSNVPVPVKARIIAATNRQFEPGADAQPFREDLYYRLSLVHVHVPPLRDHIEDIPELARYFLEQACRKIGREVVEIEPAAMKRLEQHSWPGNVRELQHTIQRSVLLARRNVLTSHDLVFDDPATLPSDTRGSESRLSRAARLALSDLIDSTDEPDPDPYHRLVEQVERALVAEALNRCQGNQVAASELLGINRTTLRKKV